MWVKDRGGADVGEKTPSKTPYSIALQLKDKVHLEERELVDLKKIKPSQRPDMLNAIVKEIQGLLDLQTFSLGPLPKGHRPLDSRIVLKVRYRADGAPYR